MPAIASAQTLELDTPLSSHAVIQRDRPIPISGQAAPGSKVTVAIGAENYSANADPQGRWRITLPPRGAGGPYAVTLRSGTEVISLDDIMVGDVWLCSGQSNMEFTVRYATNAAFEVPYSNHPMLRLLNRPWDDARALLRVLTGHMREVTSVTFALDGRTLASASGDGTVRLWDVAQGREVSLLTGHSEGVSCVAWRRRSISARTAGDGPTSRSARSRSRSAARGSPSRARSCAASSQ